MAEKTEKDREFAEMAEKRLKATTTITTDIIMKVHPKIVTVGIRTNAFRQNVTTLNLPIQSNVYKMLTNALSKSKFKDWLPLTFFLNDKSVAYDVQPYEYWKKEKAEAKAKKQLKTEKDKDGTEANKTENRPQTAN